MDKSAIDAIGELAVKAAAIEDIGHVDTPAIVGHNGQPISLESFMDGRVRFRGSFATASLDDYAAYVKAHTGGEGFIDQKAGTATTFLNLGDTDSPGHGDWTAKLRLEPTAGYAALLAMSGQRVPQRALVEWVEDWSASLSAIAQSGEAVSIAAAIASLRELKIKATSESTHTDRDFGATRTALEDIEASSAAGVPSHLVFKVEPYVGFKVREFRMRVSIITGDKPAIVLRLVGKEAEQEEIAQEFKALLAAAIGDAATITVGAFNP